MPDDFRDAVAAAFPAGIPSITLGAPTRDGITEPPATVSIPLAMMTRHGLIAGATGTGKTKSLQLLHLAPHIARGAGPEHFRQGGTDDVRQRFSIVRMHEDPDAASARDLRHVVPRFGGGEKHDHALCRGCRGKEGIGP